MDQRGIIIKPVINTIFITVCVIILFVGCGREPGEKEYKSALKAIEEKDLIRARSHLEISYRETVSIKDKIERANQLGIILWKLNDINLANQYFNEAAELGNTSYTLLFNQATTLLYLDRLEESNLILQNLINQYPNKSDIYALLGLYYYKNNDYENAMMYIKRAKDKGANNPKLSVINELIKLHNGLDPYLINETLKKSINDDPKYLPTYYNLAFINKNYLDELAIAKDYIHQYLELSTTDSPQYQQGKRILNEIKKEIDKPIKNIDQNEINDLMQKGSKKIEEKLFVEAIKIYREVVKKDKKNKNAFFNIGHAYFRLNNLDAAAAAFKQALDLDPTNKDARYNLAVTYYKNKKIELAEKETMTLLEQNYPGARKLQTAINAVQ